MGTKDSDRTLSAIKASLMGAIFLSDEMSDGNMDIHLTI
jgi:hypothetical protein